MLLLEHVQGDGWLMWAGVRLGMVSQVIDVWRIERTADLMQDGNPLQSRLTPTPRRATWYDPRPE